MSDEVSGFLLIALLTSAKEVPKFGQKLNMEGPLDVKNMYRKNKLLSLILPSQKAVGLILISLN